MARLQIIVTGKVQGVGMRQNVKIEASLLNLNGLVRNENNGSVFIDIEGNEKNVKDFKNWISDYPGILAVKIKSIDIAKQYKDFSIQY
jgi:acylphosphatase